MDCARKHPQDPMETVFNLDNKWYDIVHAYKYLESLGYSENDAREYLKCLYFEAKKQGHFLP